MRTEVDFARQRELLALLAEYGIDGASVLQDGWDESGYAHAPRNGSGGYVLSPDGLDISVEQRAWPEGFPYDKFARLARTVTGVI